MVQNGSIWVEGSELHFIDGSGNEYAYSGEDTGNNPSGATSGSIWLGSGDNKIHYIDENGDERTTPRSVGANVSGVAGSVWIENGYVTFLDTNTDKVSSHDDVAHSDKNFSDFDDTSHSNKSFDNFSDHTDDHSDFDDVIHDDKQFDDFSDFSDGVGFTDHSDDGHGNFTDGFSHSDTGYDDNDHSDDSHNDFDDTSHSDDSHNDVTHVDQPFAV